MRTVIQPNDHDDDDRFYGFDDDETIKHKTGFVIISALFYSENSRPILTAKHKKNAEKWLKDNGWKKTRGSGGELWEKEDRWGKFYWARIVKVEMAE